MSATNFGQNWPASFATDADINGVTVAAGASSPNSATIANYAASPGELLDTEVTVKVAYGASVAGGGAIVYVCRRTLDGFEVPGVDTPYAFTMPASASATCHRTETISGKIADFQVIVANPASNSTITATVATRQSQGQIG